VQALVPFTNANPHVDTFRMKFRPLVIGSKSYTIQQSMDDRPVELQVSMRGWMILVRQKDDAGAVDTYLAVAP
jgi:hypothetical protein